MECLVLLAGFPAQPVFSSHRLYNAVHRASIPAPDINSLMSGSVFASPQVSFIFISILLKNFLASDRHTHTHWLTHANTKSVWIQGEKRERKKRLYTRAAVINATRKRNKSQTKAARVNVFKEELFPSSQWTGKRLNVCTVMLHKLIFSSSFRVRNALRSSWMMQRFNLVSNSSFDLFMSEWVLLFSLSRCRLSLCLLYCEHASEREDGILQERLLLSFLSLIFDDFKSFKTDRQGKAKQLWEEWRRGEGEGGKQQFHHNGCTRCCATATEAACFLINTELHQLEFRLKSYQRILQIGPIGMKR